MIISKLINELQRILTDYGDIECCHQNSPSDDTKELFDDTKELLILNKHNFFVIPEEYDEDGWQVNIRNFPY